MTDALVNLIVTACVAVICGVVLFVDIGIRSATRKQPFAYSAAATRSTAA